MSTKIYYNFGTINNDNSRHVTINAPGADIASLVRSIFAEDVTFPSSSGAPHDNISSSVSPESDSGSSSGAPDDSSENNSSSVSSECHSDISSSFIFTKKAKLEHKEPYIIQALQKSVQGRKDKTRAFVQELRDWQKQAYVDAHFNARVMYDELVKLMPISFGYDVFRRLYNSSRN